MTKLEFNGQYEEALEILQDCEKKYMDKKPDFEIGLDFRLKRACDFASAAYGIVRANFTQERLGIIKGILGEGEYIEPTSVHLSGLEPLAFRSVNRDYINCAVRLLRTYQTLAKYQTKVEEFRKLQKLEKLLEE